MNTKIAVCLPIVALSVYAEAVSVEFEITSSVEIENSFMAYFDQGGSLKFSHVGALGDGSVRKFVDFDSFAGDGSVKIALIGKYASSGGLDGGALLSIRPESAARVQGQSWEGIFDSSGGSGDVTEAEYLALLGDGSVLPNPEGMATFLDQNVGLIHGAPSLDLFAFSEGTHVGSIAVVPEPATLGFLTLGVAALLRRKGRN